MLLPVVAIVLAAAVPAACRSSGEEQSASPSSRRLVRPGALRVLDAPPDDVLVRQREMPLVEGVARTDEGRLYAESDGAEMVLVPDTAYLMGVGGQRAWELPVQRVHVRPFLIDRHEVTNAMFAEFCAATGYVTDAERGERSAHGIAGGETWRRPRPRATASSVAARADWPVVWVSWNDAAAYCRWAGKRLPTEAEFELVLRGGLIDAAFPWGDDAQPPSRFGNYSDDTARRFDRRPHREPEKDAYYFLEGYDDAYAEDAPVAVFAQNAFGVFDVSGNVAEWVLNGHSHDDRAGSEDSVPRVPADDDLRVYRRGSWGTPPSLLRCSFRFHEEPTERMVWLGFRGVVDVE